MADLKTNLCGLRLRNPLILASGPLSYDGEAILRAHRAGAGAVVTKTISEEAAGNPVPHIAALRGGLLNSEKWSDLPARRWIERELPRAKDGGATVIASVGLDESQVRRLARPLENSGADALEVCSYRASEIVPMIRTAVQEVGIPVLAKVSANWPDVSAVASAALRSGAAGITAIDSVGPALRIDIERREPVLGGGLGWMSGPSILPIALRVVAQIAEECGTAIVGTGGISSVDDGIEMLMAGAQAVGVCSHLITSGLASIGRWLEAMSARLDDLGLSRAEDAVGAALPALREIRRSGEGKNRASLEWSSRSCTQCGLCLRVCPYLARRAPDCVDPDDCRMCGLCASACPVGALRMVSP